MCIPGLGVALTSALGLGGAATAAGATATAATAGGLSLAAIGTGLGVAGSLYSGYSAYQTGKAQEAALKQQADTERGLNAVEDARTRRQYISEMRKQTAELAARGISLDSPTAVMLGQSAAQELSFASQAVRSGGAARQTELSHQARLSKGRAMQGLISGGFSAAGALVTGAPDIWPELRA